ncbi:glycoside hydrolase family 95-like protein [Pedobacter sp. NJ-S-72]
MLLQSHESIIDLLPAIPKDWAVKGAFTGLCARGGFIVDCSWMNGKVTSYKITAAKPGKVKVRVNGEVKEVQATVFFKKKNE